MPHPIRRALTALAVSALTIAVPAIADNTLPTNPFGIFYNNSFANVDAFKHPTAILVAGQCNRGDANFAQARAAGAEVLAYINADAVHDGGGANDPCQAYRDLYKLPDGSRPAYWPYLDANGHVRSDWPNYSMLDIRAGGAWADRLVSFIEDLMRSDTVDGVFLDVIGAKNWSGDWSSWSDAERDDWTNGCIDLVRRLDASRQAINPRFLIINNNTWERAGNDPTGNEGENYVDGVVLEHPTTGAYHENYANHPFANRGHRRMLVIGNNNTEASYWAGIQGVTHVAAQGINEYGSPPAPPTVALHRLTDRPKRFGRTTVATVPSAGMSADHKRASKFTMPDTGRLLELDAYLDGQGGALGSQQVKLVVYRDNNGVPGAKVAESSTRSLADGTSGTWRSFIVTGLPLLTPGDYWIAIHTGSPAQVLRNYGDGAANWYGNADVFSDGASDPFGAGSTGSVTLSIFGRYVVGQ